MVLGSGFRRELARWSSPRFWLEVLGAACVLIAVCAMARSQPVHAADPSAARATARIHAPVDARPAVKASPAPGVAVLADSGRTTPVLPEVRRAASVSPPRQDAAAPSLKVPRVDVARVDTATANGSSRERSGGDRLPDQRRHEPPRRSTGASRPDASPDDASAPDRSAPGASSTDRSCPHKCLPGPSSTDASAPPTSSKGPSATGVPAPAASPAVPVQSGVTAGPGDRAGARPVAGAPAVVQPSVAPREATHRAAATPGAPGHVVNGLRALLSARPTEAGYRRLQAIIGGLPGFDWLERAVRDLWEDGGRSAGGAPLAPSPNLPPGGYPPSGFAMATPSSAHTQRPSGPAFIFTAQEPAMVPPTVDGHAPLRAQLLTIVSLIERPG
jgi:hypothetical protein